MLETFPPIFLRLLKHGGYLDTLSLERPGLFSAVTSALIQLQLRFTQPSDTALAIIGHISLGNPQPGLNPVLPQSTSVDPTIVHVEAILHASLAVSLPAAFIAKLGKRWLTSTPVTTRTLLTVIDRRLRTAQDERKDHLALRTRHGSSFDAPNCTPHRLRRLQLLTTIDNVVAGATLGFTAPDLPLSAH
ncbi:hypothetical protein BJ322DRAFT_1109853 [Thelephora terrestris]|uniref:DUF6535 domain-containing protein n=1 Tax=Thelephora terrestris TaxID=56493 RepID=A0A9P6HCS6_9AGAM|nr:hypothetical protein BJ322DRAFT_1109853 [Thelephora terrestris]